jgi:hypothetical protein
MLAWLCCQFKMEKISKKIMVLYEVSIFAIVGVKAKRHQQEIP